MKLVCLLGLSAMKGLAENHAKLGAENEALHERLERLEKTVQALSVLARHGEAGQRSRNTEN